MFQQLHLNTAEVTLEMVLKFRDERSRIQKELLEKHFLPLISFTMNIAGPYKRFRLSDYLFSDTIGRITAEIGNPVESRIIYDFAGCEAIMAFDKSAGELKEAAVKLEENSIAGRLLDIDVFDIDGSKLSRESERLCLVCGGPVTDCARSRKHSVQEISNVTQQLLRKFAVDSLADKAVGALLAEARLSPKPGLVDSLDNGAHCDMDLELLERSAISLREYFKSVSEIGLSLDETDVPRLQRKGIEAEQDMLRVTGGVNTHKGAIYSVGILCAAVSAFLAGRGDDVFTVSSEIAALLEKRESNTHGEIINERYGISLTGDGARGEAIQGFPHVKSALELLRETRNCHKTLLFLMATLPDSNLLWRGGISGLKYVQDTANELFYLPEAEMMERLSTFNSDCIAMNLSPGGAADLLECTLFLDSVFREMKGVK